MGGGFELSPVVSAGESLLSAAEAAIKIPFSEDEELDAKNLEKIIKAGSLALGIPKYFDDVLFNFLDWLGDAGELQWQDIMTRRGRDRRAS
jgi:hypothetical protein